MSGEVMWKSVWGVGVGAVRVEHDDAMNNKLAPVRAKHAADQEIRQQKWRPVFILSVN